MTGPLKWHGGKHYLARKIVAMMPPHTHYVEPYAGGLSVLLAKDPEGVSEVANDAYGELTNFWYVLQNADTFRDFQRVVQATPFSEEEWRSATRATVYGSDVDRAVNFFVLCRQSLAGRMRSFTGVTKTRTRRGMNNEVSAWLSAVDGLPEVHARMRRVLVLNRDALDVIRQQDAPQTLFYLDPPYLHDTRATAADYAHEMTEGQHAALLQELDGIESKFLLSGYRSELYDRHAAARCPAWRRFDFDMPNHAAGGKAKRRMVECVWCNFDPEDP